MELASGGDCVLLATRVGTWVRARNSAGDLRAGCQTLVGVDLASTRVGDGSAMRLRAALRIVPKSGMIVPEMGTPVEHVESGLASALFTPVQRRVLGLLFGQPERRFQSAEIIRLVDSGTGAVHRQLRRLEGAGLVEVTRDGQQKYYQARGDSPIFEELHSLVVKTSGVVEPLRTALSPLADRIVVALVFGSVAKGDDRADSDVDLLVVSDNLTYEELFTALETAEATLARSVDPTVFTRAEWQKRMEQDDSFATRVADQPKLFVIGSADALT